MILLPPHHLLLTVKSRIVYLSVAGLPEKRPLNGCLRSFGGAAVKSKLLFYGRQLAMMPVGCCLL